MYDKYFCLTKKKKKCQFNTVKVFKSFSNALKKILIYIVTDILNIDV